VNRTLAVEIPFPPSVNRIWRNVAGRTLLSADGRAYRSRVAVEFMRPSVIRFGSAPVSVSIAAWMPDARRRDLDNLLKAALDALTHAGCWDDDSQIAEINIRRAGISRENPRLSVVVQEV
jgi:crossover junction endodeoxyribonuclease RusA